MEFVFPLKGAKGEVLGIFFSHRAHRVHGAFWCTVRTQKEPPPPNPYPVGQGVENEVTPIELLISETKKPTSFL